MRIEQNFFREVNADNAVKYLFLSSFLEYVTLQEIALKRARLCDIFTRLIRCPMVSVRLLEATELQEASLS